MYNSYYSVTLKMAENLMKNCTRRNVNQFRKINVQEGINVQAGKFFKINKRTGSNKLRTGGKFDSKIINVPVRLLETREYTAILTTKKTKKLLYVACLLKRFLKYEDKIDLIQLH